MAKKLSNRLLLAIGGAAVAVTAGATAIITRWAIKKNDQSFFHTLRNLNEDYTDFPEEEDEDEEEVSPENDFVDTEGAADVTAPPEDAPAQTEVPAEEAPAERDPEA